MYTQKSKARRVYFNSTLKGFTLVELVIVIMMMGILGLFLFYDADWQSVSLRSEAEQIANEIRYAQNLGMTKGARYGINFSNNCTSGNACYWFSNANNSVIISNPATNTNTVNLPTVISLSFTDSAILFNGQGIPFSNTGNALTSNSVVTLSATGETSRQIVVSPQTGYVEVQ